MIEFTICHFAKNQEILRGETQPSLIVDTALSTLFGATRDIDDLVSYAPLETSTILKKGLSKLQASHRRNDFNI